MKVKKIDGLDEIVLHSSFVNLCMFAKIYGSRSNHVGVTAKQRNSTSFYLENESKNTILLMFTAYRPLSTYKPLLIKMLLYLAISKRY